MTNQPEVLALFGSQDGIASYAQLRAIGVSRHTIWRAQRREAVVAILPRVYMLAGVELSFTARCRAALLYLGPESYLCRKTAAALYGCRQMPRSNVHITVPIRAKIGPLPTWISVHWTSWRVDGDVVTRPDGLRLSSPLRTLFDLGEKLNQFALGCVAEDLWHLKLLDPVEASPYLERVRRSGRGGVAKFEAWVEQVRHRERPAQSGLEMDVIKAIADVGLPEPQRQHPVVLRSGETIHIDVAWPDILFGLEPGDSWWHGGDIKVRADMARDNACGELGWLIRRLDESLRADRRETARLVKALYDARLANFRPTA